MTRTQIVDAIESEQAAVAFGADPTVNARKRDDITTVRVAASGTPTQRINLVQRQSVPPEIIEYLADHDPDPDVWLAAWRRCRPDDSGVVSVQPHVAARDERSAAWVLERLADPTNRPFLRRLVAMNPSCPEQLLRTFSVDDDSGIREGVAANPVTPTDVLRELAVDKSREVRFYLASNPSCPTDLLERFAVTRSKMVRRGVARNPNCPTPQIENLARDPDPSVREAAIRNPNCPNRLVERAVRHDSSQFVRGSAAQRLKITGAR